MDTVNLVILVVGFIAALASLKGSLFQKLRDLVVFICAAPLAVLGFLASLLASPWTLYRAVQDERLRKSLQEYEAWKSTQDLAELEGRKR